MKDAGAISDRLARYDVLHFSIARYKILCKMKGIGKRGFDKVKTQMKKILKKLKKKERKDVKIMKSQSKTPNELGLGKKLLNDSLSTKGVYEHHAVVIVESRSPLKCSIYHSTALLKDILELGEVSIFKRSEAASVDEIYSVLGVTYNKLDMNVCLYPKMDSKSAVEKRIEELKYHIVDRPYYSFSSVNCEHIATFLMTGVGQSYQLQNMGVLKRTLCDFLDPLSFYKYFFGSMLVSSFGVMASLEVDLLLVMEICVRENRHKFVRLKRKVSDRQMFKYTAYFVIKLLLAMISFCGMEMCILPPMLFFILPPIFGMVYDCIHQEHDVNMHDRMNKTTDRKDIEH